MGCINSMPCNIIYSDNIVYTNIIKCGEVYTKIADKNLQKQLRYYNKKFIKYINKKNINHKKVYSLLHIIFIIVREDSNNNKTAKDLFISSCKSGMNYCTKQQMELY